MKICRVILAGLIFGIAIEVSAQSGGFLSSLTLEQKEKLGLHLLTADQQAALEQAVESYRSKTEAAAVNTAKEAAVADYKRAEEPSVVQRALDIFRRKQEEDRQERFTARLRGEFSGWTGRTIFQLDNGQIWKQAASDVYVTKPGMDVEVVIYKSKSGYWRLRILDDRGAWVTVERLR